MKAIRTLSLVALLLLCALPARAQEVQVPFDRDGRIEVLDAALARRLGLLVDEYPGLVEARLFQAGDSAFALEITRREGGRLVRERRTLTAEEARALRERVSRLARERAPEVGLNQEGRNLLLGQTALLGLTFYGTGLPIVLDLDGSGAAGAYLLTAGASFFVPFALTEGRPVSYGMANLSRYGATRGIIHGGLLHHVIAGPDEPDQLDCPDGSYCYYEDRNDGYERAMWATMMLTSVAEGVGGYRWARSTDMTPGKAATIGLGGDFGMLAGLGTAIVSNLDETGERAASLLTVAGAGAGIYAGKRLADRRDFTWGDASVMYTAGALGAYAGLATAVVTVDESEELAVLLAMGGSALGLLTADRTLPGKDFTVGQASLVQLGTIAGGLTGLGLGVMVDESDGRAAMLLSAAGAIGGYALTYGALAGDASRRQGEAIASNFRVHLTPAALLAGRVGGEGGRGAAAPVPLATLEYRF